MENAAPESTRAALRGRVIHHLEVIYPDADADALCESLLAIFQLENPLPLIPHRNIWDQSDIILITYADTICDDEVPLTILKTFIDEHLKDVITTVHILPFYPFSSDDGFAVIDYSSVNESYGNWDHIEAIANDYKLMADVVINHASARSHWFENFKRGEAPGRDYFITVPADTDVSQVVRPRTSPLLTAVETSAGEQHVLVYVQPGSSGYEFREPGSATRVRKNNRALFGERRALVPPRCCRVLVEGTRHGLYSFAPDP